MPVGGRWRAPRVAPPKDALLVSVLLAEAEARLIRAPMGRHRGSAADTGRERGRGDVLRLRLALRLAEYLEGAAGLEEEEDDDGDTGTDARARPGGGGLTDRRGGCEWRFFFFCVLLGLLVLLALVVLVEAGEEGGDGSG